MPESLNVKIRNFEPGDREAVRRITHDTALMGEPASAFLEAEEIISDALTLYHTDYEPQSCFVAEVDGKIAGCLIGAKNKAASEKVIKDEISFRLFWKALKSGVFLKKKNLLFIFQLLASAIKGEFKAPNFNKEYPATLHINISQGFRGLKIGSALIEAYLNYLGENRIVGVHLATMSKEGAEFFFACGFRLLYEGKRSYFSHILHRKVPLYIYGKKL